MSREVIEVRIDDLVFEHPEVRQKTVGKYAVKMVNGEDIEPIELYYYTLDGKYLINDGHHRVTASHLLGRKTIRARYTSYSEGKLIEPNFTIKDVVLERMSERVYLS